MQLTQAEWLRAPSVQAVFAALEAAGGEAMVAGGAVRNTLLNRPIKDVDFATTLPPDAVTAAAETAGFRVVPVGLSHGTVVLHADNGDDFEVTTLRRDVETDGRHAAVEFHTDWAQDAMRRDFTINALFVDRRGNVHDFVDGVADAANRRLRFVGEATARIQEDFLRILRFFRFLPVFGAADAADPAALAAIKANLAGLAGLSGERVRTELLKILVLPGAPAVVRLMDDLAVFGALFANRADPARFERLDRLLAEADLDADARENAPLRLHALLNDGDVPALRARLALSNSETAVLDQAVAVAPALRPQMTAHEISLVLFRHGRAAAVNGVLAAWAADVSRSDWNPVLQMARSLPVPVQPVKGRDLLARGHPAGPEIGDKLRRCEQAWIDSGFQLNADEAMRAAGV